MIDREYILHFLCTKKDLPQGEVFFLVPIRLLPFSLSLREVHFSGCEGVHAR